MKSDVEMPAAPQENPNDFLTTFCSLRLFPAHTNVTGIVTTLNLSQRTSNVKVLGLEHSLRRGITIILNVETRPPHILTHEFLASSHLPFVGLSLGQHRDFGQRRDYLA